MKEKEKGGEWFQRDPEDQDIKKNWSFTKPKNIANKTQRRKERFKIKNLKINRVSVMRPR